MPYASRSAHLRRKLRDVRKKAGFTQVELSQALKKPQSYVSKYESGERRLDVLELLDVLRVLKVDASAFLAGC